MKELWKPIQNERAYNSYRSVVYGVIDRGIGSMRRRYSSHCVLRFKQRKEYLPL